VTGNANELTSLKPTGDLIIDDQETLRAMAKAEIDQQIATAKQYPRSMTQFHNDAITLATLDQETAAAMMYALPRGGKKIRLRS